MRFEWDEGKAEENRRKHRVPFEQAQEIFDDPRAVPFEDLEHSTADETRYVMIGMSSMGLLVCLVYLSRGRYQVHLSAKGGKMDGKDL